MQYGYLPIPKSTPKKMIVLDACELAFLDKAQADIEVPADPVTSDFEAHPFALVYGAFIPNSDTQPKQAIEHLNACVQRTLQVSMAAKVSFCGLSGINIGATMPTRGAWRLPIAALVQGPLAWNCDMCGFGHTAYLHYVNLSLADNILNRAGVLALRMREDRFDGLITERNWQEFVDEARRDQIASRIR